MKRMLAAMLLATSALAQTQQTNLVARWSFDEGHGTNIVDSTGNGFNGVLEGEPLPGWTNGVSGFGLLFDGVQNQVTITNATNLTNAATNGLTVSAWVKAPMGTTGEIIAKWNTNGAAQGSFMLSLTNGAPCFELRVNGEASPQSNGGREESGVYRSVLGMFGRADGQWHFVAGTYDGQQMGVWWDGRLEGVCAVTGAVESVDAPVQIGRLNAVVDEVMLYSRALTYAELFALYQQIGGVKSQESVVSIQGGGGTAAGTATSRGNLATIALPITLFPVEGKGVEAVVAEDMMGLMPRVSLSGLKTIQVGVPNTRPTVQPGGYAERRAREMKALYAAVQAAPNDVTGLMPRVSLTGYTTMHVGVPNTRPTVQTGGYAERRTKEMETLCAMMKETLKDATSLMPRVSLAGLTTMQVGARNMRPTVQPGGYAEERSMEMEAVAAEVTRRLAETGRRSRMLNP